MKAILRLFTLVSLRHLRRRKLRWALVATSVVLAVALYVASTVTIESILAAFEGSLRALRGRADLRVTRGLGVELDALPRVEAAPGVRAAAPVIQRTTVAPELDEQVVVLGVDFARDAKLREYSLLAAGAGGEGGGEGGGGGDGRGRPAAEVDAATLLFVPGACIVGRSFADRHALALHDGFTVQTRGGIARFTLAGIIEDAGPAKAVAGRLVVVGLGTAQGAFGLPGRCDRIEVGLPEGADAEAAVERLAAALGPGYTVEQIPSSNATLDYVLGQQRITFMGVTVLAMLIGAFIVFNSLSLSVVERVKDIGILRALGARRREIVLTFVLEAAFVGALSSAGGVVFGVVIARLLVDQSVRQLQMLSEAVPVEDLTVPPLVAAAAMIVGALTAMAGAAVPALSAARVAPMTAIRRITFGLGLSRGYLRSFAVGTAMLLVGGWFAVNPDVTIRTIILSLILALAGIALMLPQVILWLTRLLRGIARHTLSVEGFLAVDNITKFPARTALTVIAFAGSLSIVVSTWGTLGALETSVGRWLDGIFPFDLSVQQGSHTIFPVASFPAAVVDELQADPRVDRAYGVRVTFVPYERGTVLIVATDQSKFMGLRAEQGMLPPEVARRRRDALVAGGVIVSENFAYFHRVGVGDRIELPGPKGPVGLQIADIVEDYSWPRGVLLLDQAVYAERFADAAVSFIDVKANDGVDLDALGRDIERRLADRFEVTAYPREEIRDASIGLLREWFRLADVLILLSVVIGGIGLINTMLISVISQSRQIGLLRAVGASTAQIRKSLAVEAVCLGTLAGGLGALIGLFVTRFPMAAWMLKGSGYPLAFVVPWDAIAVALGGGVGIALLAATIPIRYIRRIDVLDAIGYE